MSKINNGGPAFPGNNRMGMTLRDYFAAKAMQSFIIATADNKIVEPSIALGGVAKMAYMQADAMLAAREEGVAE